MATKQNRSPRNLRRFLRQPAQSQHRLTKAILETLEARTLLSTITVNTTSDSANPGTGLLTLRQAITSTAAGDTINFDSSLSGQTIYLSSPLPNLTAHLTIDATVVNGVTINGQNHDSVFTIQSGATVTMDDLTITGGSTIGSGGGIDNLGTLTLHDSTITGNSSTATGGGIYNSGTLSVFDSTITGGQSAYGGGINNQGTLIISDSIISNSNASCGGGINNSGTLSVFDSTISGNSAGNGGGIYNTGYLRFVDSTISGNSGTLGAGVYTIGSTTITGTTFNGNSTLQYGDSSTYGGGVYAQGSLTITNSTFNENFANAGGAIFSDYATVSVVDSTISGNTAQGGDGIYNRNGSVDLEGTIVAKNNGGDGDLGSTNSFTGTYNLIGDGTGMSGLSNGVDGNQVGTSFNRVNPLLAPLGYDGGVTATMALLPGSPAIDHGAAFNDSSNNLVIVDQRGFDRTAGEAPDIGAYENQGKPDAPINLSAMVSAPNQIDLSWLDDSQYITGYTVWISTNGTSFTELTSSPIAGFSYSATGLSPDATYTFEVEAENSDGESLPTSVTATAISATLTTSGPTTVAEVASYTLALSSTPSDTLSWPIDHWLVNWNDGTSMTPDNVPATTTTATDSHSFPADTTWADVTITAVDTHGNTFALPDFTIDVIPAAPTNLTATVTSSTEVDLSWTNNSDIQTSYTILRSDGGATYSPIGYADPDATTFTDTTTDPEIIYQYQVEANGPDGSDDLDNSTPATSQEVTTDSGTPTISVVAGPVGSGLITVTWTYQGNDDSGFELEEEDQTADENYQLVWTPGPVGSSQNYFIEDNPTLGDTYFFRIRADHTDGTVSDYVDGSATPTGLSAPTFNLGLAPYDNQFVMLTWANLSGEVQIQVTGDQYVGPFWHTVNYGYEPQPLWPADADQPGGSQTDPLGGNEPVEGFALNPGVLGPGTYQYRIRYFSDTTGYVSDWSSTQSISVDTVPAGPVLNLTPSATGITVSWQPPQDATALYNLYMVDDTSGIYDAQDSGGLSYTDLPASCEIDSEENPGSDTRFHSVTVPNLAPGSNYYFLLYLDTSENPPTLENPEDLELSHATTQTTGTTLAAPAFVRAVYDPSVPGGQVRLSWGNLSDNETGFKIYRSDSNGNFQLIKSVGADVTTYIDKASGVWPWVYEVVAVNNDGSSTGVTSPSVKPIGGPDISAHLLKIRADLRKWYFGLNPTQQAAFKAEFISSVPQLMADMEADPTKVANNSGNWDIALLKSQNVITSKNTGILPNGIHTVTVAGQVYADDEVNYWLYGVIGAMLGWSQNSVFDLIEKYRELNWKGTGIPGRIAWTAAGFAGDLTVPQNFRVGVERTWNENIDIITYTSIANVSGGVPVGMGDDVGPLDYEVGSAPLLHDGKG